MTGENSIKEILRGGYYGNDGEIRLILDEVKVPAGNIYSTRKIDLLSTEQMLLNEILKNSEMNSPGDPSDNDNPPDDSEATGNQMGGNDMNINNRPIQSIHQVVGTAKPAAKVPVTKKGEDFLLF